MMSYWNYRVVEDEHGTLGIHEVFYNEHHKPEFCTVDPIDISGMESIQEMGKVIKMMEKAMHYPILNHEDF